MHVLRGLRTNENSTFTTTLIPGHTFFSWPDKCKGEVGLRTPVSPFLNHSSKNLLCLWRGVVRDNITAEEIGP